jgi:hypothetical protein
LFTTLCTEYFQDPANRAASHPAHILTVGTEVRHLLCDMAEIWQEVVVCAAQSTGGTARRGSLVSTSAATVAAAADSSGSGSSAVAAAAAVDSEFLRDAWVTARRASLRRSSFSMS